VHESGNVLRPQLGVRHGQMSKRLGGSRLHGISAADPNTKIVPGHGAIATRDDVIRFRDMIVHLQALIQKMVGEDKSESEVLSARLTAPYDSQVPGALDPVSVGGISSADRFVGEVYKELAHPH
jgi:hypothetical protein